MQFETRRLILRDWYPNEDARKAMDIYGDARVMAWDEAGKKDASIRDVQWRLQAYAERARRSHDGLRNWAVVQKDIGRVIGTIELAALPDLEDVRKQHVPEAHEDGLETDYVEMSWYFRPASWGYGYATEAAFCVAEYCFEVLGLSVLLAIASPENTRAVAVMDKLGMRRDGFTTRRFGGEALLLYLLSASELRMAKERWLKDFVA